MPEYFANYRDIGDELAAFLGASIIAKVCPPPPIEVITPEPSNSSAHFQRSNWEIPRENRLQCKGAICDQRSTSLIYPVHAYPIPLKRVFVPRATATGWSCQERRYHGSHRSFPLILQLFGLIRSSQPCVATTEFYQAITGCVKLVQNEYPHWRRDQRPKPTPSNAIANRTSMAFL